MALRNNTYRILINIAGKILFVIGLVLNILMLFFGFWPSIIYIIIMFSGMGMISFNKKINIKESNNDNKRNIKINMQAIPATVL